MAPEDEHEFDRMAAGLIDVANEYLQEKEYPYKVMMVKPAQDLMLWTPGTVLVVLEPKEREGPPPGSLTTTGAGR